MVKDIPSKRKFIIGKMQPSINKMFEKSSSLC